MSETKKMFFFKNKKLQDFFNVFETFLGVCNKRLSLVNNITSEEKPRQIKSLSTYCLPPHIESQMS